MANVGFVAVVRIVANVGFVVSFRPFRNAIGICCGQRRGRLSRRDRDAGADEVVQQWQLYDAFAQARQTDLSTVPTATSLAGAVRRIVRALFGVLSAF